MIGRGGRFLTTFGGWRPRVREGWNLEAGAALSTPIPLHRFRKDSAMFAFPAAQRPLGLAASVCSLVFIIALAGPAAAADGQGYLGLMLQDLTPSMAKALQLDDRPGVMINDVVEGGPAQKAGLLAGDVVLQLNGKATADYSELTDSVRALAPGQKASLLILRDGRQKTIDVEVGKREAQMEWLGQDHAERLEELKELHGLEGLEGLEELAELENLKWLDGEHGKVMVLPRGGVHGGGPHRFVFKTTDDDRGWLGVHLDALNSQLGEYFGVEDGAGVLVTEVVEGSPAAAAGLQAGDVVVKVGETDVATPDALHEAMAGTKPGDDLKLQVLRKGVPKTVSAKLGEMPGDAMGGRRIEIIGDGDGDDSDVTVIAPRMLRHMRGPGSGGEREIIIQRKQMAGEEMDEVRQEMEALREELKLLREELKR
jgi:membrane-associated protease RseP (regulator of RpoE activity)